MVIAYYRYLPCTSLEALRSLFLLSWLLTTMLPSVNFPLCDYHEQNEMQSPTLSCLGCGAVHAFPKFFMAIGLPFCGPNEMDHYFCDNFPLLKIAGTDTYITDILVIAFSGTIALVTFAILSVSCGIMLFTLKKSFDCGKTKSLFYLWISYHHSHLIFCAYYLYLH